MLTQVCMVFLSRSIPKQGQYLGIGHDNLLRNPYLVITYDHIPNLQVSRLVIYNNQSVHMVKMAVFWVVAPCSLVEDRPDDGGRKHL
jgi:hypothetical protein